MGSSLESLVWVSVVDNFKVEIYTYMDESVPKIHTVSRNRVPELVEVGLKEGIIETFWSIPTRSQMESYRKESASYNLQTGSIMVDEILLSDCVVSHHMKGLVIGGTEVALHRDNSGNLTPDSLSSLKSMHAGIYDLLYDKYKSEACLY